MAEDGLSRRCISTNPRRNGSAHFLSLRWMAVFRGSPRMVVFVSVKYRVQ
jgi:hypothetical protein